MRDVLYFLQGYGRMALFKLRLLDCRVRDEYLMRTSTASDCVMNGECLACGCKTPALMMANKACSAPKYLGKRKCYPRMGMFNDSYMRTSEDWNTQVVQLGSIQKGKSYYATFFYKGDKKISRVETSCGCTKSDISPDSVTLKLSYSRFSFGPLADVITKHATVYFEDGSTDMLRINGHGKN